MQDEDELLGIAGSSRLQEIEGNWWAGEHLGLIGRSQEGSQRVRKVRRCDAGLLRPLEAWGGVHSLHPHTLDREEVESCPEDIK